MNIKKKDKIGIVGWRTGERSFGIGTAYYEFLSQYGKEIIILKPNDPVRKDLDLLVLPGGADVSPARYGEVPSLRTGSSNAVLEYFDINRLPAYIDQNTPMFGICRGFQTLQVHFGGKLVQHLPYHPASGVNRANLVHGLIEINDWVKVDGKVNSIHHQGVLPAEMAPGLNVMFVSDTDDQVVEAFRHVDKPIAGVQWHPEEIYDSISNDIIMTIAGIKKELPKLEV